MDRKDILNSSVRDINELNIKPQYVTITNIMSEVMADIKKATAQNKTSITYSDIKYSVIAPNLRELQYDVKEKTTGIGNEINRINYELEVKW